MEIKKLKSGFSIPTLGIGTYGLGGGHERDDSDDEGVIKAIRKAIDLGFTHIDTAELYGLGHSEELLGKAIKGYDRSKLFIVSKVLDTNLHYDDVIKSCKKSIERIGIKYLDLYLIHLYNPEIPLEETMRALNFLVDEGLIKNIGVCNFTIEQLKEAQKYSRAPIVNNQMKMSLWTKKSPDYETMDYCRDNDIIITAYKLFGRGKIISDPPRLLVKLGEKYGKKPAQIVTNWVCKKKNTVAIFTSRNEKHMKENMDAINLNMLNEDYEALDREFINTPSS